MQKQFLMTCLMALTITVASNANAKGYDYSWWKHYFGKHKECHKHNGNHSSHYYWTRYFWWHNHCPNQAPTADAGVDQTVVVADQVTLDGSASSDADGFIRSYRWRQVSGPRVRLRARRSVNPTFVAPEVTEATELVFRLRVNDNLRKKDRDTVTITVSPDVVVSQPPVADAGADQTVDEEVLVTLNGSASSDPDNDINTYLWEQVSGSSVSLVDADSAVATFTAPELNTSEVLEFRLTVSDSESNSSTDTTTVTVEPVVLSSQANVRVRTIDGSLVSGVQLEFYVAGDLRDDLTATVNETAALTIDADTNYSIKAITSGYAIQIIPFRSAALNGNVDLDITLIPRGNEITISGAGSFAEEGADGAAVSFTTSDFVDADGNPVVGDIQLTITPVDVSQPATLAAFPGEFTGILEGSGDSTPIISLGTVEYEFTANGQPINLAPGATADVLIPIYNFTYQDGSNIAVGDTIPLWSLNEDTGVWDQEGTGTVIASIDSPTGLALSATVSHFSWWNCDVSMQSARVEVTVIGPDSGTATIFGTTAANIGFRPNQVNTTIPVNSTSSPLFIPSNNQTCLWVSVNFNNGSSVTTPQQCVTPAPSALITLTFGTGSTEPLDILATPGDDTDIVFITDYLQSPIDTILLSPVSIESQVSYTVVSGGFPVGVNLTTVNARQAEISGITTESGNFSAVVLATDDEGNTDEITVNLTINPDIQPPLLTQGSDFLNPSGISTVNLNDFNDGGFAVNWSLLEPLPVWISFDNNTGVLTINADLIPDIGEIFEQGVGFNSRVEARNSSGISASILYIDSFGGEGISVYLSPFSNEDDLLPNLPPNQF